MITKYSNKYSFLNQNNIKFKIVHGTDFIGLFAAYENSNKVLEKYIYINIDYIITNKSKLLKHIILHEITHALDYTLNDGWRTNNKGNIKEHDKVFKSLCKLLDIPFYTKPWYKINKPKIKKRFNHLETIKLN